MIFRKPEIIPLNDNIRAATQGESPYYSNNFILESSDYHRKGHVWEARKLEKFFQDGLLQYYIGELTGINLNHYSRYLKNPDNFLRDLKEKNLVGENRSLDIKPMIEAIFKLLNLIKNIPLLNKKGGYFQRLKQLNEQYDKDMQKNILNDNSALNDTILKIALQNDSEMEILQFEIYNWVNYSCAEIYYFIQSNQFNWDEIANKLPDFTLNTDLYPDREELAQEPVVHESHLQSSAKAYEDMPGSFGGAGAGISTFFSIKNANNFEKSLSETDDDLISQSSISCME